VDVAVHSLAAADMILALLLAAAQQSAEGGARLLTDPGALFGPDSYPAAARRAGEQGRVVARLAVDADGAVTACAVTASSGSASLDARTCEQARLARFAPARDPRGRAVPAAYTLPVHWVLPAPVGWAYAPWRMAARLVIDAQGGVSACTAEFEGDAPRQEGDSCGFRNTPAGALAVLRGPPGGPPRETTVRIALWPGEVTAPSPPAGATAFGAMRLVIAPDGTIGLCEPLVATGAFAALPPICGLDPGPFVPAPAGVAASAREAVMTIAVTVAAPKP
jgi:TonB family protein